MRDISCRKLLTKVQRCATLGTTSAPRSILQASLDIILYLLPIEDFVAGMGVKSLTVRHRGNSSILSKTEIY